MTAYLMRFLVSGYCICWDERRGELVRRFVSEEVKETNHDNARHKAVVEFEKRTGLSPIWGLNELRAKEYGTRSAVATLAGFPVTRDAQRD